MSLRNDLRAGTACGCGTDLVQPPAAGLDAAEPRQGVIPATAELSLRDHLGAFKVRWGIGRNSYRIRPGLYSLGQPGRTAPVLVTANYKLSFDSLRRELGGLDAWILVLDTHGVNVWCAAGKGTFGTAELVRRVRLSGLSDRVSHRTLVLPQLGAPGVAAHRVKKDSGFNVVYGPVRARDIRRFLSNRMSATPAMRAVTFNLRERLAVAPEEIVAESKYLLIFVCLLALWLLITGDFSLRQWLRGSAPLLGSFLTGTVAVPALLPWIPFRSFALKGWLLGLLWALLAVWMQGFAPARLAGNLLFLPAISAYLALNYTGSTTFTSQSGVNREIRLFARPMALAGLLGILVLAVSSAL